MAQAQSACADTSASGSGETQSIANGPPQSVPDLMGFLDLIEPQIGAARARLQQGIEALVQGRQAACFDPARVVDMLFAGLPDRLLPVLGPTLILELHVARLQDLLPGNTPGERFRSFIQRLRRPEVAQSLFDEYSVLADQVAIRLNDWVAFSLQFLRDLAADWPRLATTFDLDADGERLERIETGAGDPHRGGRTVTIAHFRSGARLVYRPSSVAVAVHFQQLLAWLNARGAEPPFHTLKILDCGDHGWMEFVAPADCSSHAQVTRFYRRQGGYLALLHALAGTDFHYENLIARGEHPALVDLEGLFHQPRQLSAGSGPDREFETSVRAVGMLPREVRPGGPFGGADLSGLGAPAAQLTPLEIPCWQGAGTDEMHLGKRRLEMPAGRHRPTLHNKPVDPVDYLGPLCDGFSAMYRLLCRHRHDLLSAAGEPPCGVLSWFVEDETRFIARPTQGYATLLGHCCHPDRLRDPRDRDALLDRLNTVAVDLPWMARLVAAERADLSRGDIPLFSTRPGSRHLWDSQGGCQPDFFDCSGLDLVRQRVTELSEDDLERQVRIIRASFASREAERKSAGPVAVMAANKDSTPTRTDADMTAKLRSAACAVADRLASLARSKGAETTWLGMAASEGDRWSPGPVGLDLSNGLSGITLFLFHIAALEGEERFARLAESALATLSNRLERTRPAELSIGGFLGWGGVIYVLTQVGLLTNRPGLLNQAEGLVAHLPSLIEQDRNFDVIGGAAGCLVSLLRLHRATGSGRSLALAIECGDHLLRHAQSPAHGIAWSSPGASTAPLTGFSHGAAGVAWALLNLAAASGAERFRTAAQAALAYERSLFCHQEGNWPDFRPRPGSDGPHFGVSWCNGAPGIGLARLRSLHLLEDPILRSEIDTALQTTCAHAFGSSHTLCCGDLGKLELLLQADIILGDPRWRRELDRQTVRLLGAGAWRCATAGGLPSPALLTGLTGIGYGLLRLARPDQVPSVLTLDSLEAPGR